GHEVDRLSDKTLAELGWDFVREDGSPLPAGEQPAARVCRSGRPVRNLLLGVRARPVRGAEPASGAAAGAGPATRRVLVNALPRRAAGVGFWPPAAGGVAGEVVTTFADITPYVRAQEGVRLSEERYRGLVESLPLMLMVLDRDLRVKYFNSAAKTITG